jgi:hypothetical protein
MRVSRDRPLVWHPALMAMLRFTGGPWDGTEREMDPVETGSPYTEAFYTDDPGAGCYKAPVGAGDAATPLAREPIDVRWHPSALR